MPGWRGYLPESVDRPGAAVLGPRAQRAVALGALVASALAGGAVVAARSTPPPGPTSGSADDPTLLARSAAWTQEATPVLTAVEAELGRSDELRHRWDASPAARHGGPPPGSVVALLQRREELAHHRDALRAAMAAIRAAPASEPALASAWPALRAAEAMLRATASDGRLRARVEAAILGSVDEGASVVPPDGPSSSRAARTATPGGHAAAVALVATTSELPSRPAWTARLTADVAGDEVASAAPVTDDVAPAPAEDVADDGARDTPASSTPRLTAATAPDDLGTGNDGADDRADEHPGDGGGDDGDDGGEATTEDGPTTKAPGEEPGPAADTPPDETILTFERAPDDVAGS